MVSETIPAQRRARPSLSPVQIIAKSVATRATTAAALILSLNFLPLARAEEESRYVFRARPSNDSGVAFDVQSKLKPFNFSAWRQRGLAIRSASNRAQCYGNLSLALSEVGSLYQAGSSGASGALTLLPTAGALIGAPAQELWILYKLIPIAGVLSMLLSLGGSIVPQHLTDYEDTAFTYEGMVSTREDKTEAFPHVETRNMSAEEFAKAVEKRVHNTIGSGKKFAAAVGMGFQLLWISAILIACHITQSGGIVAWWCKGWGWMYVWYSVVAFSSILENYAGVPFTKQWTMRVSKAPEGIEISDDAPILVECPRDIENHIPAFPSEEALISQDKPRASVVEIPYRQSRLQSFQSESSFGRRTAVDTPPLFKRHDSTSGSSFLNTFDAHGVNPTGRIIMYGRQGQIPSPQACYVIISVAGIERRHAVLRVFSKFVSVGVFALGTAGFASATLITITVSLTTLSLILCAGVFGRVASLWLVKELMKQQPILQRTVKDSKTANEFVMELLAVPGLTIELNGHVFLNGRCIYRYNPWLRWSAVFGMLTEPFRVDKLVA